MKVFYCDKCNTRVNHAMMDGWTVLKTSVVCESSMYTGKVDGDVMHLCPECSKMMRDFIHPPRPPSDKEKEELVLEAIRADIPCRRDND